MNFDLQEKVVLVTGASGGIGSAIARSFAEEGARLVLHYRSGRKRALELQKEIGSEALVLSADLTSEAAVTGLFGRAIKHFGRIDTVIANAGSWETKDIQLEQMSLKQWRQTHDAVLTSVFLTLREFFKQVRKQRRGNAVLISSTAGIFGEAGHVDYASAKSALAYGMVRTVKNELARLAPHTRSYCGGRINVICPGWTVVPRTQAQLGNAGKVRQVTATMSLPKIARPEDIAPLAVFLASDRLASHLTGQTIAVAGGMEGRWLWQPEEIDPSLA